MHPNALRSHRAFGAMAFTIGKYGLASLASCKVDCYALLHVLTVRIVLLGQSLASPVSESCASFGFFAKKFF